MSTNERVSEVVSMFVGNAKMTSDVLHEEFIIIPRDELPESVTKSSSTNGWVTALAQEFYQPRLVFSADDGDKPGEWNRKIAYANLAIAEAVEATARVEREELEVEAHLLYEAAADFHGLSLMASEWAEVKDKYVAIALAARKMHRKAAS